MTRGSIDPRETDLLRVRGNDAFFAYSDAMRIAAQIFDHLLRTAERWFGIDYEGFSGGFAKRSTQGGFVTLDFALADGRIQMAQELPAKHGGQSPYRYKVGEIPRYPPQSVRRDTATGNYAMQVRVEGEFLIPGMQDCHAANTGAEILGIRADGQQSFADAHEEGVVEEVAIGLGQGKKFVGNREDHMEVWTG